MSTGESTDISRPIRTIGSYRLLQQLGSGGMSSVFRAVHQQSNAEVAVKILPKQLAQNPTLLQRFINEAKNAEKLQHPNIVAIFDRGFDQGRHYLVLEYVEGGDLQDRVRDRGPLSIEEAVSVIRQVAEGLRHAAGQGVIHRDIKPANLLLTPNGKAKIIDLGLAVEQDAEDERVTRHGTTVGTVDYMAPEQARNSRATSEASDIYSLGCTFYYLLTGSPPYPGGDIVEKLSRHCTSPIPDPRERRPDVPEALARLIQRMMAKTPIQRFAGHTELLASLNALSLERDLPKPLFVDDLETPDTDDIALLPVEEERPVGRASGSDDARRAPVRTEAPPSLREIADAAGGTEETSVKRRSAAPPVSTSSPKSVPKLTDLMDELVDDGAGEDFAAPMGKIRRYNGPNFFDRTSSLKTFIGVGVAIGLAIAFVGVALVQLFIALTESSSDSSGKAPVTRAAGAANPSAPKDEADDGLRR